MSEAGTWHTTRTLALARSTNSRCTFVRWHCAVGLSVCLLLQKRMNRSRRHFGSGHEGAQETMRLGCSHATAHIWEGHTRTCPAVDILKVTHKRAAGGNVACSYQLLWQLFVYWAKTDHAFSFHRPWPCTRPHQLGENFLTGFGEILCVTWSRVLTDGPCPRPSWIAMPLQHWEN